MIRVINEKKRLLAMLLITLLVLNPVVMPMMPVQASEANAVATQTVATLQDNGQGTVSDGDNIPVGPPDGVPRPYPSAKIEQNLAFEVEEMDAIYGTMEVDLQQAYLVEEDGVDYPDTEITYEIVEGANLAAIDVAKNLIYIQNGAVGDVVIEATKEGNDCFLEGKATYVLHIKNIAAPALDFTLKDSNKNVISIADWHTGPVYIYAPNDWLISKVNSHYDNKWEECIGVDGEGVVSQSFYLREKASGGITAPITLEDIKIDNTAPSNLAIEYSEPEYKGGGVWEAIEVFFYNFTNKVMVTLSAQDAGSGVAKFTYYESDDQSHGTVLKQVKYDKKTQTYSASFAISEKFEGKISFEAQDYVGNSEFKTDDITLVVENDAPELVSVSYGDWIVATSVSSGDVIDNYIPQTSPDVNLYYNSDVVLDFLIEEEHFYPQDVCLTDNGNPINKQYLSWEQKDNNQWMVQCKIPSYKNGEHIIELNYTDRSQNGSISYTSEHIIIDTTYPNIQVNFGRHPDKVGADGTPFYNSNVEFHIRIDEENFDASKVDVTVNAYNSSQNTVSGCDAGVVQTMIQNSDNWECHTDWYGNKWYETYFVLEQSATYDVGIVCADITGNISKLEGVKLAIDKMAPTIVELEPEIAYHMDEQVRIVDVSGNDIEVVEPNSQFVYGKEGAFTFGICDNFFEPDAVEIVITRDGVVLENGYDYFYNPSTAWTVDEENADIHYATIGFGSLNGMLVDGEYQVFVNYTDASGLAMEPFKSHVMRLDSIAPTIAILYDNYAAHNENYYNQARTATIVISDENINGAQIVTTVSSCDAMGNPVDFDLNAKQSQWERGIEPHTWQSTITYDADANFEFQVLCTDAAGHSVSANDLFVVDTIAPEEDSLHFEYTSPLVEKLLSVVSLGFYNPDVTVRITAKDVTSPIDCFVWNYTKQAEAGDVNVVSETHVISSEQIVYDEETGVATAEFTLSAEQAAQYRGNITFCAVDKAGNSSAYVTDNNHIVVVDTISPTRMVTYSPAKQVISKDDMRTLENFSYTSENTNAVLYYDAPMTMTFRIQEENFFAEDPVIMVNDTVVSIANWSKSGDEWIGVLSLSQNGSYIVTMEYMDNSQNRMQTFTSEEIVIDLSNPLIEVIYSPDQMVQQIGEVRYYGEPQTATIVITEDNFRAWDVDVSVSAKNAAEEDVAIDNYAAYLRNSNNWVHEGNKHTATISFANDANYTFDVSYRDLAGRESNDVPMATFTVDTAMPTNLSMTYSTSLLDRVIEGITFGFYNAPVTVTVVAEDETSGVNQFEYSYLKAAGVSDVNTEATNVIIPNTEIAYTNGRKTATATFQVPSSALDSNHQFNGTVEVVAYDCVKLQTKYVGDKRLVVDNIAPNVKVEYSNCTRMENEIQYFNSAVQAVIHVTEANFYPEDVKVMVAKDGGETTEVRVNWNDQSVDHHTGAFSISEDGEYTVTIEYTDRSHNAATSYQSGLLIVDTIKPVVRVQGVRNHSANRDATIGFILTVEDLHVDGNSIVPSLKAEVRDEDGNIRVVDMSSLGQVSTVVAGKNYIYTVTNLERDAIYSLDCEAKDMAGNEAVDIMISDSGNQLADILQFSVNRNGSTYSLSEATRALNGNFTNEPTTLEIREVNPDELVDVKVTLFKNEKTIDLEEGRDYTIDLTGGSGNWYLYEYRIYENNFQEDGIYRLAVYSEDAAGNISQNTLDVKDVEISFGVDKTAPNLIITNLEDNETYPVEHLNVVMQASDNMKLSSVKVKLDGKEYATWEQEEIDVKEANMEDFTFDIVGNETKAHTVEVVLTDIAGNRTVGKVGNFYVTTDVLVQVTNNTVLPIAGAVAATGGVGTTVAIAHGVKLGKFCRFRKIK